MPQSEVVWTTNILIIINELKYNLLKYCFIAEALKHITCFFWLKKFLYTFFAPNSQMSLSSVMVPSVSDSKSKKAHWASASIGAMMYGMPNSCSSSYQHKHKFKSTSLYRLQQYNECTYSSYIYDNSITGSSLRTWDPSFLQDPHAITMLCMSISMYKPPDQFSWNLVPTLWHWSQCKCHNTLIFFSQ